MLCYITYRFYRDSLIKAIGIIKDTLSFEIPRYLHIKSQSRSSYLCISAVALQLSGPHTKALTPLFVSKESSGLNKYFPSECFPAHSFNFLYAVWTRLSWFGLVLLTTKLENIGLILWNGLGSPRTAFMSLWNYKVVEYKMAH